LSHVTDQDLRMFIAGELDFESRRRLLAHLLSGCPGCKARTAGLALLLETDEGPPAHLPRPEDSVYTEAGARFLAAASALGERIRRENAARERFLALVRPLHLPYEEILDRIETSGMPTRACVEALLALSFEERARDPWRMLQLAQAARLAASSLPLAGDAADYSPSETADLETRVWVELANAYRRNDDFPKAEGALARAEGARVAGSGDLLLSARLLDVEASLRTDQRRYDEAHRLLDLAIELYEEIGERHLAGRALMSQGIGLHYDGEAREAVARLRRSLSMLDGRDAQLLASARKALLDAMAANGEYAEAAALLLQSGLREAFADEPVSCLKVRWLEGRIFAGLGKLERAAAALMEARESFLEHGLDYEGALAGLECIGVLLQQGRLVEVEELATEALEIFEMLEIQPEAVRAVSYLQKVCMSRKATVALVREVVSFVERLERRPELRFFSS
jgi:tetratricopeptide (TPR) repeat protein